MKLINTWTRLSVTTGDAPCATLRVRTSHAKRSDVELLGKCPPVRTARSAALMCFRCIVCSIAFSSLSACGKPPEVLTPLGALELPNAIQSMAWHPNGKWLAVGYFRRDEVEVWDVVKKQALFAVRSKRWLINQSGQEVLFSPDGKYMVVQDLTDTKNGEPKFPKGFDDVKELPAQKDSDRYVLARIWDVQSRREVGQVKGAGSTLHGADLIGMCFVGGNANQLAILRDTVVSVHALPTGARTGDINLRYPFADKPDFGWGYRKMACHPQKPEATLQGSIFMAPKVTQLFGYPENSGATPIVVVDLQRQGIRKVLFSETPLNGVAYTADGSKLVSFGKSPIRVWDSTDELKPVGTILNPPDWLWLYEHRKSVDRLNPPRDIPLGNVGKLLPVDGTDLMFGLSGELYLWDISGLKAVFHRPTTPDAFRIAVHQPSAVFAVADGRLISLLKLNLDELNQLTTVKGKP